MDKNTWDVFISHATEDKESFVRPLALALRSYGLRVWYDEFSLTIGDGLRKSIEDGLANSRFGIVIISPSFAGKSWTERELSTLYMLQGVSNEKIILPIWHNIDQAQVLKTLPMLADVVALKTSSNTLQEIVEKIIIKTHSESIADISNRLPSGIAMLDALLGGGMPRPSTISLVGQKGIGKSTLATQIQISSLFRGEPCIYITYREPPFDIIARFIRLKAPIEEFISRGFFRIIDNYSVLNGLSKEDVENQISNKVVSDGIVRIENPTDVSNYFKQQTKLWKEMGTGGVNVIDSVNERYELIDTEDKNLHFMQFRARIKISNQSGIHIVTELPEHEAYNRAMNDIQGGIIRLFETDDDGITQRKIKIDSLRDGKYVPFERSFSITNEGVEIY